MPDTGRQSPKVAAAALAGILIFAAGCKPTPPKAQQKPAIPVWIAGDVNLGEGGKNQLKDIAALVKDAAGIVNLEGPAMRPSARGKLHVWNSSQALQELRTANVRVAGIVNNHALDAGQYAPVKTAELLRDNKILAAGGFVGPAILRLPGGSVVITAHDLSHGVPAKLQSDLASARRRGDVLIATFYATGPASYIPRPDLREAVETAYRSGADVITANGTHALGAIERRGHAIIAWGLGSVAFACDCSDEKNSILLRLDIQPHGDITATVIPIQPGINSQPAEPSKDPDGVFNLLESLGSTKLERHGSYATF